jgi:hypothetical protein
VSGDAERGAARATLPGDAGTDAGRWWYWVAAVPAGAALWLVSFAWLAVVATAEFGPAGVGGNTVATAFWLATLVTGVPLAVILVVFPVAVQRDARALGAVGATWQPDPQRWGLLALVGSVTVAGSVPVAVAYLRYRLARVE